LTTLNLQRSLESGNCKVLGKVPWKERVQHVANIGVVFGQRTQLWWDLPVIDSLSFWSIQSLEIVNSFTYGGVEAAQYPLSIYKFWFRKIFIFVIPLACINYFPAMAILEKVDPLKSPICFQWIFPMAGIIFFLVSLWVWKFGVKHYKSTGS